jgi:hypothetical protein
MKLRSNLLLCALLAFGSQAAVAQEVEYETASRMFLPGGLGKMMDLAARMGGGSSELKQTVRIKGTKMRTDDQFSSTIFDLTAKKYIFLDHNSETYTEMSTDEMAAQLQQMQQGQTATKATKSNTPDYKVEVEPTNETETIAGASAKRSIITVTSAMRDSTGKKVGDFVIITDTWTAKETPIAKANEKFAKAALKAMGGGQGAGAALAGYPGAGEALQKAAEEANKGGGYPMRMTFHVVIVPDGVPFDRAKALAEAEGERRQAAAAPPEEKKKKGGFGGALKSIGAAAKAAAASSQQTEETQNDETPRQVTLMRMFTEVKSVKTGGVPADAFNVPANYTKEEPETD